MALRLKMSVTPFEIPSSARKLFLWCALSGIGVLTSPDPCGAAEPPTVESPDLIVEEDSPKATESTSSNASAIDPTLLLGTGQSLTDAIEHLPGVHLRRTGGFGSHTSVGIRGLGMNYVTVVLNNTPLHLIGTGGTDLSLIPLEHILRIEIFRGGGPLPFETPIGGVLRIITRLPPKQFSLSTHLGYGSYNSYSTHVSLGGPLPVGDLAHYTTLTHQGTSGSFPFWNDNATLYNPGDDFEDVRRNNASEITTANLTLQGNGPGQGLWELKLIGNRRHDQQPGPKTQRDTLTSDAHSVDQGISITGELRNLDNNTGQLKGGAQFYAGLSHRNFISNTPRPGLDVRSVDSQFASAGISAQLDYHKNYLPVARLAGGIGWQHMSQRSPGSDSPGLGADINFKELHPYLAMEFPFLIGPSFQLLPTLRLDALITPEEKGPALSAVATPKLGFIWEPGPGTIRANFGQHHRTPTFTERFGDGLKIAPSPKLTPEKGALLDFGYQLQTDLFQTRLEAGLFFTEIDRLIVLLPTSQRYVRAHNLNSQRLTGVELGLRGKISKVVAGLNYTYIDARSESSHQTPGVPTHRLDIELGFTLGGFTLTYNPGYQSPIYLDPDNRLALPHRLLHNLSASYPIPSLGLTLRLNGRNLSNTQSASISLPGGVLGRATQGDYLGYPLPGRSLFASCTFKL